MQSECDVRDSLTLWILASNVNRFTSFISLKAYIFHNKVLLNVWINVKLLDLRMTLNF